MALISTVVVATTLQGETDSSMSSTVKKDYIKSIEVSIDVSESDQNTQGGMFTKNMLRNTRYYRNTFFSGRQRNKNNALQNCCKQTCMAFHLMCRLFSYFNEQSNCQVRKNTNNKA